MASDKRRAASRGDRPVSRVERRQAARTRRNRLMLGGAAGISALIVGAWFPAADLLHQRQQLTSATSALDRVRHENKSLAKEQKELASPTDTARIAREQDQLVPAGDQAYQVLPSSQTAGSSSTTTTAPGAGATTTTAPVSKHAGSSLSSTGGAAGTSKGFVTRVVQTLEFWR